MAEPFEARHLPKVPETEINKKIFTELLTAITGFPHSGDHADAALWTIKWFREHHEEARIILDMHPGLE